MTTPYTGKRAPEKSSLRASSRVGLPARPPDHAVGLVATAVAAFSLVFLECSSR